MRLFNLFTSLIRHYLQKIRHILIVNLLNPIIVNSQLKGCSDEEALDQYLLTQNVNYFNLLYERYSNKVFAKCVSMLKEPELAEDATQDIFIKVLLSVSKFSGRSKFSTWLYSITYNYCIDLIRKDQKQIVYQIQDYNRIDTYDDALHDAEILETNVHRLKIVLSELHADDKSILMMKYQDEMTIRDICDVVGKTESAVKMKLLRAKERFLKVYNTMYKDGMEV